MHFCHAFHLLRQKNNFVFVVVVKSGTFSLPQVTLKCKLESRWEWWYKVIFRVGYVLPSLLSFCCLDWWNKECSYYTAKYIIIEGLVCTVRLFHSLASCKVSILLFLRRERGWRREGLCNRRAPFLPGKLVAPQVLYVVGRVQAYSPPPKCRSTAGFVNWTGAASLAADVACGKPKFCRTLLNLLVLWI